MHLAPFAWPEGQSRLRQRVVLSLLALLAAKIVTVCIPYIYKLAVDGLSAAQAAGAGQALPFVVLGVVVAYGAARAAMVLFTQGRDILFTHVAQHATRVIASRTFEHLHALSLRFHLDRKTGGLSRVLERGKQSIDLIVRNGVLYLFPTVIELALVLCILAFAFGWAYAAIVFVTVGAYLWFTFAASEWRIAIRRELNDSDTDANTKAIDSLLNFETVKYFGAEAWESRRFDASMARYEKAAIRTYVSLAMLNSGQAVIFTLGLTASMLLSARAVASGEQTLGDFVMINAMLIQLYIPLNFMGMIYRELKQGLTDIEDMFALVRQTPEVVDKPGAPPLVVSRGEIRFENVRFAYDPDRVILKGVDFVVPPGGLVAIVGPSGAGKSTISRLLFRFYDVTGGRILIDGQDIRDVTQESVRAAIGIVPQDTVLFNDTIDYNIRYGSPNATDEQVRAAAEMAQIDRFITSLPKGYQTMVGERGLKLSGGEKQRVAIARTILKGPPILMLDEATSALDTNTEKDIQQALDTVSRNRTTLVIAHRLSTIIHADAIIVLDQGVIAERGSHAELLAAGGIYAKLWTRQQEADEARQRIASAVKEGAVREPVEAAAR
ncbi:MAG: ABC transporter ATP-binding protein/permease [Hyphomicrobiales bacterium]|nr:ABC transporter ATP-binding protein/permease [Hyphomicrobiales bacterium]